MAAVSLQLNMPIQSACVVNEQTEADPASINAEILARQSQQVDSLCKVLQQAAETLQRNTAELFFSHKEQIVRLSVKIAAKILAKNVQEQNYEIEKIISQALQTVPVSKQITIRLNPDDLKTMQELTNTNQFTAPQGVRFTHDASIGPSQCIIETDHGVIEYLIEEHLKQVADALLKTKDNNNQ
jgi:flagellar assembly protein FliH